MQVKIGKSAINAKPCTSYFSRAIGLMFTTSPKPLLFILRKEGIYPLHMWFVFFPIDVVFMDKSRKIVELKQDFFPFTFYTPKKKAKYILELPKGSIKSYKIRLGQRAIFK